MGLVYRSYACDSCGHEFEILQDRNDGPPDNCPKCAAAPETPYLPLPRGLNIGGSNTSKAVDMTYRSLEESGQRAFEQTGNPHTKVTNLKDNLREGDVAAVVPQPSKEYQAAVAAIGGQPGFGAGSQVTQGESFSPAAMLPGLRGTANATPALGQLARPDAPHRRLTGRFQRPK